jgi:hypothetical protein
VSRDIPCPHPKWTPGTFRPAIRRWNPIKNCVEFFDMFDGMWRVSSMSDICPTHLHFLACHSETGRVSYAESWAEPSEDFYV